jgi:hypothetical protein
MVPPRCLWLSSTLHGVIFHVTEQFMIYVTVSDLQYEFGPIFIHHAMKAYMENGDNIYTRMT